MTIADDSGLVVPALGGAPGVYSARYAGHKVTDKDNRRKLLKEMEALEELGRSAYFECAMALASPEGLKKMCERNCCRSASHRRARRQWIWIRPLFLNTIIIRHLQKWTRPLKIRFRIGEKR